MFAYGQTGSGKTYTMEGGPGIEEDETQCGVIPRTIRQIFDIKNKLVEKSWSYKLTVSLLVFDFISTKAPTLPRLPSLRSTMRRSGTS